MEPVACFWCEPTARVRRFLRRFTFSTVGPCCPANAQWGHDASEQIEDGPAIRETQTHPDGKAFQYLTTDPFEWPRDDPRWPKVCAACGYRFQDNDVWQLSYDAIYRTDSGIEFAEREMPPGAMYHAWWLDDIFPGPDGKSLTVVVPPGFNLSHHWNIDGPAKSEPQGGAWTRYGAPPRITANPSILTACYHGWLRDGYLVDA